MAYLELFDRVAEYVRSLNVECEYDRGSALTRAQIEDKRERAALPIPPSMIDFYLEVGDGLEFWWACDAWDVADQYEPRGEVVVPPLEGSTVDVPTAMYSVGRCSVS